MHKDVKMLVNEYIALGCRLEEGRRHYKIIGPDGRFIRPISKGNADLGFELLKRMRSEVRRMREARR